MRSRARFRTLPCHGSAARSPAARNGRGGGPYREGGETRPGTRTRIGGRRTSRFGEEDLDIRIRTGTRDEAEALTSLARRAKASRGYPDAWLEAWQEELRFDPETFERCEVFVAAVDRRPVGVVALSLDAGTRQGEIEHLWVEPGVQGAGIGRRLVRHALSRARRGGARGIRVVSDPGARGFYERLGATLAGHLSAPVLGTPRELPILRFALDPAPGGGPA